MKPYIRNQKPVPLPLELVSKARQRARSLGLSFNRYLHILVAQDVATGMLDPWPPAPKHVQRRWAKEVKQFEEEEKKGLHKTYDGVEELMHDLGA